MLRTRTISLELEGTPAEAIAAINAGMLEVPEEYRGEARICTDQYDGGTWIEWESPETDEELAHRNKLAEKYGNNGLLFPAMINRIALQALENDLVFSESTDYEAGTANLNATINVRKPIRFGE